MHLPVESPGTIKIGNESQAALGCVAEIRKKGLLVLEEISGADVKPAKRFIEDGKGEGRSLTDQL